VKKIREGYKMTELGEIPEAWSIKKMENIIESTQLGTNTLGNEEISDGIPMLKMGNLSIGRFKFDKVEYIKNEELDINKQFVLNKGDFLFNTRNTLELVGKSATWNNQLQVAIFNSNIMKIKYNSDIDSFYMSYYFEDNAGWKELKAIATGTTSVAAIYTKDLMKVRVKVPTLKEQQKISLILSTVDEKLEITDNLIEKTKELKKGLMKRLLTKGIGHEKFKDTEIGRIPEEWEVRKFKEIFKVSSGNFLSQKNVVQGEYPVYGGNGITSYHNEYLFEDSKIVIGRVGAKCGCVCVSQPESWITDNALFISDKIVQFEDDYMFYLLNYMNLNQYANQNAQPVISGQKIYELNVALPSKNEQEKIANVLLSVDEIINKYKSKKEKLQELKKGLMQKLLTGKIRVKV
jgi:type I restriction enzyme S subunit